MTQEDRLITAHPGLVRAVLEEDIVEVERLLQAGVSHRGVTGRKSKDDDDDDAGSRFPLLVLAAKLNATNIARLLLQAGADLHTQAEEMGEVYFHTYWEDVGDALSEAAKLGHFDVVELFLQHGARSKAEALMAAVSAKQHAVMKLLLDHGALPAAEPFNHAAMLGDVDAVALLFEYGANPGALDGNHTPAIVIALRYERADVVALLLKQGAIMPSDRQFSR
jgi:ankyrin repeat protein